MACLVQVVSGFHEGMTIEIEDNQEVQVGRSPFNAVVLSKDSCISGTHASLTVQDEQVLLKDLYSSNGCYINRKKIPPGSCFPVEHFFVIGSTVLMVLDSPVRCALSPLAIDSPKCKKWMDIPLFAKARELTAGHPFMHSGHLFLSILELHGDQLMPFFKSSGIPFDLENWKQKLSDCQIFSPPNQWINYFLKFLTDSTTSEPPSISPKVQMFMEQLATKPPFDPLVFFHTILNDSFNLGFPFLQWQETRVNWKTALSSLRQPTLGQDHLTDAETMELVVKLDYPDAIWKSLYAAFPVMERRLVLSGARGTGKSSILRTWFDHRTFSALPKPLRTKKKGLFDAKSFEAFHPNEGIPYFYSHLLNSFKSLLVIGIDHADYLFRRLGECNLDHQPLITAINQFPGLVILGLRNDQMGLIRNFPFTPFDLGLNDHIWPHLAQIHRVILEKFERNTGARFTKRGEAFLLSQLAGKVSNDIGAFRAFLEYSVGKVNELWVPLPGVEKPGKPQVSEAAIQKMFRTWHEPRDTRALTFVQGNHNPDEVVLAQIEELLQNFVKHIFKVHLRYNDRTQHFTGPVVAERAKKLEELKSHVVHLLSSYQSGFRNWFDEFWAEISPETLQEQTDSNSAKRLWQAFLDRAKTLDGDYAEDRFNETTARLFLEALRKANNTSE